MPDFFALFCTVDQRASYINALLEHAEEHSVKSGNNFCLIESPDQKRVNKPTGRPVSDFKTGFAGWSIDQLGQFCKEKFDWRNPKSQAPYIADDIFAVLDERTLEDGTIVLAAYSPWRERIDPNDLNDDDEAFIEHKGFRTARAPRNAAPDHLSDLPELDFNELIAHMKPEDNGVIRDEEYDRGK